MWTLVFVYACVCMGMHVCAYKMGVCLHVFLSVCACVVTRVFTQVCSNPVCACRVCVGVQACVHVCVSKGTRMCACSHVCVRGSICMFVHVNVHASVFACM